MADLRQAAATPRSVLVKREAATFDPFETSTALSDDAVAMPAADPAPTSEAIAQPAFDPFEQPAVQQPVAPDESQVASEAIAPPSLENRSEEPKAVEQSPVEEIEEPENALSGELSAEEIRDGASAELVITESEPAAKEEPPAPAEDEPRMEDELVAHAPVAQQVEPRKRPGAESELMELEKQYGGQATPEQLEARRRQLEAEQKLQEQKCERLYEAARSATIKTINLDIQQRGTPGEDFPFECLGVNRPFLPRSWAQVTYQWKAPSMCNKPLYFEEVQLERYGHDWGPVLQPIMSGAHFFGTVPILPYKMGLEPPQECIYTLGYYRPGSCAPYIIEPIGFTWRAAAFEAAAWTGGVIAIP